MTEIILDSSALIALFMNEKGANLVEDNLCNSVMSAVNITEVVSYIEDRKEFNSTAQELLRDLAINIIPYDEEQAFLAGKLRNKTKFLGLSLGDRACLALASIKKLPVLTADKAWAQIDLGIKISLIR